MLLTQKTIDEFGYDPATLSKSSNKKIYTQCDYCSGLIETTYYAYNQLNKNIVNKDACSKCRGKKTAESNLIKYGVENVSQRKAVRDKVTKTLQDRYGVINPSQCSKVKGKIKQTNLAKYGTDYYLQSQDAREKTIKTCQERYGVDNPGQDPVIKAKIKRVLLDKYGVENVSHLPEVRAKAEETCLERYGVKYASQNLEIKEKIRQSNQSKYGVDCTSQIPETRVKAMQTNVERGHIKLYNGKTMKELAAEHDKAYTSFCQWVKKYGIEYALAHRIGTTLEHTFEDFLKAHSIEYQYQFGVQNRIADFYLPESNLLIEVNGLYYHSDRIIKDKTYHINKKNLYIEEGYDSLFFNADEIDFKFPIVQSIVLNKLGRSNRIFARKCQLEIIDKKQGATFFEENHLMGAGSGTILGLIYQDELVSAMRVRKIKGDHYDISRFAHKVGTTVVGGFSRLLSFFERNFQAQSLRTFIDRRYGVGAYLTDLGFKLEGCHASFKWTDFEKTYHRMSFKGNSGYSAGLAKLWDCGQAKYIKEY